MISEWNDFKWGFFDPNEAMAIVDNFHHSCRQPVYDVVYDYMNNICLYFVQTVWFA